MIIPQLVGSQPLADVEMTEYGVERALSVTLPAPLAKVVPANLITTDQQIKDYASAAHAITRVNALTASSQEIGRKWAEATFWYWVAYRAIVEKMTNQGRTYQQTGMDLLQQGNTSSDYARSADPTAATETKPEATAAVAPVQIQVKSPVRPAAAGGGTAAKSSAWKWWLVGGVGVLLLGTVITVVVRKRRPRKTVEMQYARA